MNAPNILISAAGGDIGMSVGKSLSDTNHVLLGCDLKSHVPVDDIFSQIFQVPPASDADRYIRAILELIKQNRIDFFIPVSEPEIGLINRMREVFERENVALVLNNKLIIDTFLDKLQTAIYLRSIGIQTPESYVLTDYGNDLGYPLVVKSRHSCGSKKMWIAEDETDLNYFRAKDDGSLIVQELIGTSDQEYTTGVFSDGRKTVSITFKRILGFGGLSIEAELVNEPFLDRLSEKVALATHLRGSINIQTRYLDGVFIPFEINPRFSSTLSIRKQFGFNDARWWIDTLKGKAFTYAKPYQSGKAKRILHEIYYDLKPDQATQ